MTSNIVYDLLVSVAPINHKITQSNWLGMNGPCCIHNGQNRPDTRKRAGIRLTQDNIVIYNCFNCSYTATWRPGYSLSKKMSSLISWFGIDDQEIRKLEFKIWQLRETNKVQPLQVEYTTLQFPDAELPPGAAPFSYWLDQPSHDPNFVNCVNYMATRGEHLFSALDYWWSPNKASSMNRRVIIPFLWHNKIVGWTARATFDTKYRYMSCEPVNYLFNTENIQPHHEYIIITEGPFDAIAVGGVACLGNGLSLQQCKWLNQTGKKIIVLPDREQSKGNLIDIALRENWYVSFPYWDRDVKDAAKASQLYGGFYTLWSVLQGKTTNKLEINIKRKMI